jgi:hypothetical protein
MSGGTPLEYASLSLIWVYVIIYGILLKRSVENDPRTNRGINRLMLTILYERLVNADLFAILYVLSIPAWFALIIRLASRHIT